MAERQLVITKCEECPFFRRTFAAGFIAKLQGQSTAILGECQAEGRPRAVVDDQTVLEHCPIRSGGILLKLAR